MTQRIVPFIGYEDAAGAIDWLERAFGFVENRDARHEEGGTIGHAELNLDEATVYLSTPDGYASPKRLRETSELARRAYDNPWVIDGQFVEVDDVDAHRRPRAVRRRDHPARARGSGSRLSRVHGRGPRGAPVDVRRGAPERRVTPLQGRCLCGGVRFEVTEPFIRVSQCHCEFCKRISGGYGTVSGRVPNRRDQRARRSRAAPLYTPEGGSAKTFCSVCGSNLFGGGWPESESVERTPERVRPRLRPQARGAHVRPLGRRMGDPPRRRPPAIRHARSLTWRSGSSR